MSGVYYAGMADLEIVGHVNTIPDASELSQALAARVKLLVEERDELAADLARVRQELLELRLEIGEDKIAAYQDLLEKAA